VGAVYSGALVDVLCEHPDALDAVSLIPETLWHESDPSGPPAERYRWIPDAVAIFDAATAIHPVVFHGIGLSLGSAGPIDAAHLEQVAAAADRYRPCWVSEHLAAFRVGSGERSAHAGVGLPIAFEPATYDLLAPKVEAMMSRLGVPVLLENSAIYVEIPGSPWTEAGLLSRLCRATGCGVLLDLHNLYVNELNLGWDGEAYLDQVGLEHVVEIHVAGGEYIGEWYTDAHSGPAPERVNDLLTTAVAGASSLQMVTFELHESRYDALGLDGLLGQLGSLRAATRERCDAA
jgi:uncharacterized protein